MISSYHNFQCLQISFSSGKRELEAFAWSSLPLKKHLEYLWYFGFTEVFPERIGYRCWSFINCNWRLSNPSFNKCLVRRHITRCYLLQQVRSLPLQLHQRLSLAVFGLPSWSWINLLLSPPCSIVRILEDDNWRCRGFEINEPMDFNYFPDFVEAPRPFGLQTEWNVVQDMCRGFPKAELAISHAKNTTSIFLHYQARSDCSNW